MGRRPKTNRVPRTRAGGEWTEAAFWSFLRSLLRQGFVRWPPRSQALRAARVPYTGPDKRRKWSYRCAKCGRFFKGTEVQVDHIVPCGTLKAWEHLAEFARRLFCEVEGLRVLCKPCHHAITKGEK